MTARQLVAEAAQMEQPMDQPTPDILMSMISGHMAAKYLFVGTELGLFERLAAGPATLPELAERLQMTERTTRILADALRALTLLEHDGERYSNGSVAATFLSGTGPRDLRPVMRLWDKVVYKQWLGLEESLKTGARTMGPPEFTPEEQAIFSQGVATLTGPSAMALSQRYDFSGHRSLLDLGGGTGSFLRMIGCQAPHLQMTLFERPEVIAQLPESLPFEAIEGDMFSSPIPEGHDVFLLGNVVHIYSPEHNQQLFQRIRASAQAGARLLLVDFWTDPTHTQPPFAALMAAEFLIYSGEGAVYSVQEVGAWLAATGWRFVEHQSLSTTASLIIAEAAG